MRLETSVPLDDWRSVAAAARHAEDLGYDGIVSFEIAHDPFVPLALAALETERIRLGTAIAVCFPRSPMVVANTAWDLHAQSGGRFTLGLGTQVKGHNVRRFSVPWSPPLPRLREYIDSLRAIWRCWEHGDKLQFEGEHYQFTLMTPEFSPKPTGLGPIPISVAAVKPRAIRAAARRADGVRLHGFATRRYLDEVVVPNLEVGLADSKRDRSQFEVWGGGFIATGSDEEAVAEQLKWIRYRIAFYASTRTYHDVLAVHGWEDLGAKLYQMSKRGQWDEMAAEVSDEVIETFTAIGTFDRLVPALSEQFGGISDALAIDFGDSTPDGLVRELLTDVRKIPTPFRDYTDSWDS